MDKTRDGIAILPAGADAQPQSPEPEDEKATVSALLGLWCAACLRVALLAFVAYAFAVTAWRARRAPGDLAFVADAYAALAALLLCLRRAERLTPASPASERRRVHAAVWALSTVLSLAFAYRVAALMPPALAALVWCMTSFVVLAGLYMLVLCKDEQYKALGDVDDCDAAAVGDGKPSKKINNADELV